MRISIVNDNIDTVKLIKDILKARPRYAITWVAYSSEEAIEKNTRAKIYADIAHLLSDEQPVNFLVFRRSNIGFRSDVKGIEPGISIGYNYYLWHFE